MIVNTSSIFVHFFNDEKGDFKSSYQIIQICPVDFLNMSLLKSKKYFVISKLSRKNNKMFVVPVRCHNASQNMPQFGWSQYYHSKSLLVILDRQTIRSDQIRFYFSFSFTTNEWMVWNEFKQSIWHEYCIWNHERSININEVVTDI